MSNEYIDTCKSLLTRLVVRRNEYVAVDELGVVRVESVASILNDYFDAFEVVQLSMPEFEIACEGTYPKTELISDNQPRFPQALLRVRALGVKLPDGRIRILDGASRARALFRNAPDTSVEVVLAPLAVVERFSYQPENDVAAVFNATKARPPWASAGDDDTKGGDLHVFANILRRGRPPTELLESYIESWAAQCGFELITRKGALPPAPLGIDNNDYNGRLAQCCCEIHGKKYKAFHPLTEDDGDVAPRENGGRYATWKRKWKDVLAAAPESYCHFLGMPSISGALIDVNALSDEDLQTNFVLLTRALEAFRRYRSAERFIAGYNQERDGAPDAEKIEQAFFGGSGAQQDVWLDWPAQMELAKRFGINAAEFMPSMAYVYDMLNWWSQIFFIERGLWKSFQNRSEFEQFLMWFAINGLSTNGISENPTQRHSMSPPEISPYLIEWRRIFSKLEQMQAPKMTNVEVREWDNALHFSVQNCYSCMLSQKPGVQSHRALVV